MSFKWTDRKAVGINIFLFSVILGYIFTMQYSKGEFYLECADGKVYLSVADNFLKTGHFYETVRNGNDRIVCPPGLPVILTFLKILCNSTTFIISVQYVIFGLTNVLLCMAMYNFFDNYSIGICTSVLYSYMMLGTGIIVSLAEVLTEHYVLFLIACIIYQVSLYFQNMSRENALWIYSSRMFLACFAGYLIRPVFLLLFIMPVLMIIYGLLKKEIKIKWIAKLLLIPAIILLVNCLINFRETGHWIMLEDYSAIPLYLANNPDTKTEGYYSGRTDFGDETYWEIMNQNDFDQYTKNAMLKTELKKYVLNNIPLTIINSLVKFYNMFILNWNWSFYIMFICASVLALYGRKNGNWVYPLLGMVSMLMISLSTSCGLSMSRYSIIAVPFYAVYKGIALVYIVRIVRKALRKYLGGTL